MSDGMDASTGPKCLMRTDAKVSLWKYSPRWDTSPAVMLANSSGLLLVDDATQLCKDLLLGSL